VAFECQLKRDVVRSVCIEVRVHECVYIIACTRVCVHVHKCVYTLMQHAATSQTQLLPRHIQINSVCTLDVSQGQVVYINSCCNGG